MKISGRRLAHQINKQLSFRVKHLRAEKNTPRLAIVNIGKNPASLIYIKQKQKTARTLGVRVKLVNFKTSENYQEIAEEIKRLAVNPKIHGIIIQRPLPPNLSTDSFNRIIPLEKDVDGFLKKTLFIPPVAGAVMAVLEHIHGKLIKISLTAKLDFIDWLKSQQILLIGRGITGGKPIAKFLSENRIKFINAHRQTHDLKHFSKSADILISAVGRPGLITPEMIKKEAILIGVGVKEGRGDFEENAISKRAGFYTPTPGGIGPLTVSCLLRNTIQAAEICRGSSWQ